MTRVSSFGIQNAAIAAMISQQAKISHTQQQLASGYRINRASDDPVSAGIAVAMDRAAAENARYGANANLVNNRLTLAEVTLADVGERVQRLREITIQANGGIYNQQNRKALLVEVQAQYDALLAIANMPDGQGRYLFAGSQDATVPFLKTSGGPPASPASAASYTTAALANFDFATIPAIATDSTTSGAYTQAASTDPNDAFQLRIDGVLVSDRLVGDATDANLDLDIAAFVAASAGAYTQTGTVAGGDLVISRTDGDDMTLATSFSDAIGSTNAPVGTTSDGTFADASFIGTHTGGTLIDTSANRTFSFAGPGGTALTVNLTTNVTDLNGLVTYIQGLTGYAASGATVAASGSSLAFTASTAGAGSITITGANEFDTGGSVVFGAAAVPATPIVAYVGDQTIRDIEIGAGQSVRDVDAGSEIFLRVGAGRVSPRVDPANTGTAVVRSHSFTNPGAWTPDNYRIVFNEPIPGTLEYAVLDGNNAPLVPPVTGPYVPDQAIEFKGFQVSINGTPANGDAVRVEPMAGKSIFQTTADLIALLQLPDQPVTVQAAQANGYYALIDDLSVLGDHITDVRANMGARMSLIDSSVEQREAQMISIKTTLSSLRDLNYAEAIGRLSQEVATLDAAQSSYLRMQSLSLFDKL